MAGRNKLAATSAWIEVTGGTAIESLEGQLKPVWVEVTRGTARGRRGQLVYVDPPDRRPRYVTVSFGDPRPNAEDLLRYGYPITWVRRLLQVP
jgi:hypothetical protein